MLLRKQITGYGIILLLAAPIFLGTSFLIQQHLIQNDMKEKLEKASLQTISIPSSDIKWSRAGEEIWLGNQLFDIKSMQVIGENTIFTGLYDLDESYINNKLISLTEQPTSNSNKSSLFQWIFFTVYTEPADDGHSYPDWIPNTSWLSAISEQLPVAPYCNIFAPPKI